MPSIITSPADPRHYRHLRLDNGLRVLLVQDNNSKQGGAAVVIGAGHFMDPDDCHGLSHLLEHMLFLGCQDFPAPNHLQDSLTAFMGQCNAWTGTEQSSYHFYASLEGFNDGIAQLAAMLKHPLFKQEWIAREIDAIDAEFLLKAKDDLRRLYQVHKETCNQAHPFSKFSVGRKSIFEQFSLQRLQDMLIEYHASYYVADNMTLALVSPLSLAEQQHLVEKHFQGLSTSAHKQTASPKVPLYLPGQLGVSLNIIPITKARRMIVTFAMPSMRAYEAHKPLSYLSHLLGDEAPGSLYCFLKKRGWVTSLSAGGGVAGSNFKDFNINMQLTESGMDNRFGILKAIFATLALIAKGGITAWRHEEKRKLYTQAFRFQEYMKPGDYASHLAINLMDFVEQDVLFGDYRMDHFAPAVIKEVLGHMRADNMRVKVIARDLDTDTKAKWYDTPYSISALPGDWIAILNDIGPYDEISLSPPNSYISTREKALHTPVTESPPRSIDNTPGKNIWFGQDARFCLPKGETYLSFDSEGALGLEQSAHKSLWVAMLQDAIEQQFYPATSVGLNYRLYGHQCGFGLHTTGYAEKQLQLASEILQRCFELNMDCTNFEMVRQRQIQSLENSLLNKPINRLFAELSNLMQPLNYSAKKRAEVLRQTELPELLQSRDRILARLHAEGLIYGDWSEAEAQHLNQRLDMLIPASRRLSDRLPRQLTDLRGPKPYQCAIQGEPGDTCVVYYFQAPNGTLETTALTILLEQLIAGPFFNQLRTHKQMGYMVGTGYMPFAQHPGIALYIQSPNFDVQQLVEGIDAFRLGFAGELAAFPPSQWQQFLQSVRFQLTEKDTNLSTKVQRLWTAIGRDDRDFCRQHQLLDWIKQTQQEDLIAYYQALLDRRGFGEVLLYSQRGEDGVSFPDHQVIDNIELFKSAAGRI